MGAIGGLLGTAGGVQGTGISGPAAAQIQNPVTQGQINSSQTGVNGSLASQNALLSALQNQNGVGNQASVFNQGQNLAGQLAANNGAGVQSRAGEQQSALNSGLAGLNGVGAQGAAMGQQNALNRQLGGAQGVGAQEAALAGLQNLAGQQAGVGAQYQGIANGTGPNPALAQLNQATGQNVANQAALMAGQRGAGANVGLLARQAGQQGAATQQQAAGQAATMQAQQQLNALAGLTAQQQAQAATQQALAGAGAGLVGQQQTGIGQQYGQGAGAVNQQQTGIGQQFGQGATQVGQQQGQLGINAGIAQNQVGNLAGVANQGVQGNLANTGQQLGAMGQFNQAQTNMQGNINTANAGLANTTMKGQQDVVGGLLNVAGPVAKLATAGMAEGGEVEGTETAAPVALVPTAPKPGPTSSFGQFLMGGTEGSGGTALKNGITNFGQNLIDGLSTPKESGATYTGEPMATPAGMQSTGSATGDFLGGGTSTASFLGGGYGYGGMTKDYRSGGGVKAKDQKQKAVKSGNSYDNDKIPAMLSEGEVVIPRSVMQSKDPVRGAADFVAKVMAKRGKK